MGKSKYRTRTSYFLVTTSGNLRKISPTLICLVAALLLAGMVFAGSKCLVYNQQLVAERDQIQAELTRMDFQHQQIEQDIADCQQNKRTIATLLNFNTERASDGTDEK